ncbi:SCO family protein [Neobacillus ginsengisoli]|uniref:Cytochrome oxidase Cu insertion factor (SCO1/SenC/PrrC family) n=1 Tax=Neobacillus ginsengisoli TaxID=904295 RepID=A0ABT9XSX8_9BACI|nr:SCO family protein [Neobacillus ginsengisoli]MDQ0198664.1 cytochrome oxidase Cu insertion factor (SCO1/SenC/PrrC family) [Neobacillus ginsengisoli]
MKKFVIFIGCLILVLIAGCSGANSLQVKLSTPKTFTPGKAFPMLIKILDKQGKPVKGAKVSAELNMKNMDHGTIPVSIEETGDGKYIGIANISMNGDWVADIKVDNNGKTEEVEKQFTVAALTKENAHRVTKQVALPEFKLIDENGKLVTKQDLLGKTVAMTFTYVNCDDPNACPILLGNFSNLQQDIKSKGINSNNILLVSISIDPKNDTPAKLKEHAKKMKFDTSYLKMLTGEMTEIKKLSNTLGEHFEKKGSEVIHDNKTFIFNPDGQLTHEFSGSYIDRDELFQVVTGSSK